MPAAGRGFLCLCQYAYDTPFTAHEFQEKLSKSMVWPVSRAHHLAASEKAMSGCPVPIQTRRLKKLVSRIDKMLSDSPNKCAVLL